MNNYQLIDELCRITSLQADIIRRQQSVIMQHGIEVEDPAISETLEQAEEKMDIVEMELRNV